MLLHERIDIQGFLRGLKVYAIVFDEEGRGWYHLGRSFRGGRVGQDSLTSLIGWNNALLNGVFDVDDYVPRTE